MAISLNTASLPLFCFSGAPIIIAGTSNITAPIQDHTVTMPRVILDLTVKHGSFTVMTESFVYNLDGSVSPASFLFNLCEPIHAIMRRVRNSMMTYSTSGMPLYGVGSKPAVLHFTAKIYEEYLLDGAFVRTSGVTYPGSGSVCVIEGVLTDKERSDDPSLFDLREWVKTRRILSSKPVSGDVWNSYYDYFVPTIEGFANMQPTVYQSLYENSGDGWRTANGRTRYNSPVSTNMYRMLILNRFGMIDTAVAFSEASKSMSLKQTIITSVRGNTFVGGRAISARIQYGDTEWHLSSGEVSKEWAEWWATEVLKSERAWLYDQSQSKWLEGVIVPAEKNVVFDRTKSQATVIPFTFRCTMQS